METWNVRDAGFNHLGPSLAPNWPFIVYIHAWPNIYLSQTGWGCLNRRPVSTDPKAKHVIRSPQESFKDYLDYSRTLKPHETISTLRPAIWGILSLWFPATATHTWLRIDSYFLYRGKCVLYRQGCFSVVALACDSLLLFQAPHEASQFVAHVGTRAVGLGCSTRSKRPPRQEELTILPQVSNKLVRGGIEEWGHVVI